MYKRIFVNQCGYQPEMEKKVTFRAEEPVQFTVLRSDGSTVFEGLAEEKVINESAKETDFIGDFSKLKEEGRYYISARGLGESDTFAIGGDVYLDVLQKAMHFFYLQRCGFGLSEKAAGIFAHKACHLEKAVVYGSREKRDVCGGWHDAGDYGRYVGPGAMAAAQLLLAYEANRELAEAYCNPVYETKKQEMPAYLAEVKYELDWMMKMQREDGALYHKVSCYNFCGFIMPEEENEELVISPVSVTATADFAAVMAMAVRFYKGYDETYAAKLEQASRRAYDALKGMTLPGGFRNPKEITTGEYGDACDKDERYWAAAELYKAFGEEQYRRDFEALAQEKIYHGYGWTEMGSYGNRAYLSTTYEVDEKLKKRIKNSMADLAEEKYKIAEKDGYGTALLKDEYTWGSNLDAANNGLQLCDAWFITGDEKYRRAAEEQLHYLLGRNPMGLCYLTGCGTDAVKHPHHRPSGFLGKAMPGMLSGGPCNLLADETVKQIFTKETPPAKSLADMTGSYSTNEVTIYWNSAFIQLLCEVCRR
ncbi:MAG: glycoside hydrolase family 9 protein [Acetatifactor sp.]